MQLTTKTTPVPTDTLSRSTLPRVESSEMSANAPNSSTLDAAGRYLETSAHEPCKTRTMFVKIMTLGNTFSTRAVDNDSQLESQGIHLCRIMSTTDVLKNVRENAAMTIKRAHILRRAFGFVRAVSPTRLSSTPRQIRRSCPRSLLTQRIRGIWEEDMSAV